MTKPDSVMTDVQFRRLVETSKTNFRDLNDGNALSIEWLRQYHAWLLTDAQSQYEEMITVQTTTEHDDKGHNNTIPMVPLKAVDQLYDRICMMETSILVQATELQRAKGLFTKTNTELQSKYMTTKTENERLRKQLEVAKHRALLNGTTSEEHIHSHNHDGCNGDDDVVDQTETLSLSNLVAMNHVTSGTSEEMNNSSGGNDVATTINVKEAELLEKVEETMVTEPGQVSGGVSVLGTGASVVTSSSSVIRPGALVIPSADKLNNENTNNNTISDIEKTSKYISLMTKQHDPTTKEATVTTPAIISEALLSIATTSTCTAPGDAIAANAPSVGRTTTSTVPTVVSMTVTTTTTAADKGQQRRKLLWRAVIDPTTTLTYFYNRKTKQTTWERPLDYELQLYCD